MRRLFGPGAFCDSSFHRKRPFCFALSPSASTAARLRCGPQGQEQGPEGSGSHRWLLHPVRYRRRPRGSLPLACGSPRPACGFPLFFVFLSLCPCIASWRPASGAARKVKNKGRKGWFPLLASSSRAALPPPTGPPPAGALSARPVVSSFLCVLSLRPFSASWRLAFGAARKAKNKGRKGRLPPLASPSCAASPPPAGPPPAGLPPARLAVFSFLCVLLFVPFQRLLAACLRPQPAKPRAKVGRVGSHRWLPHPVRHRRRLRNLHPQGLPGPACGFSLFFVFLSLCPLGASWRPA